MRKRDLTRPQEAEIGEVSGKGESCKEKITRGKETFLKSELSTSEMGLPLEDSSLVPCHLRSLNKGYVAICWV